jgi:hypothetical protein
MTRIRALSALGSFVVAATFQIMPTSASSLEPTPPLFVTRKTAG